MVSFQCDACGDTVKKPKLDNHYSMCHSSVTCLDCSTTFSGPMQFKSHIQCISEAEKYQKGLYKGPKQQNVGPRGAGQNYQNGAGNTHAYSGGKYQQTWTRQGGAWGGPQQRYEASGANSTPLGTPVRMSPVTAAPSQPPETGDAEPQKVPSAGVEKKKKKKRERKRKSVDGAEEVAALQDGEVPKKKKTRHSEAADINSPSPAKPSAADKPSDKNRSTKKSKQEKKDKKGNKAGVSDERVAPSVLVEEPVSTELRMSEKSTESHCEQETHSEIPVTDKKSKRHKKEKDAATVVPSEEDGLTGAVETNGAEGTVEGQSKKRKRANVEADMSGTTKEKRSKKDRKSKSQSKSKTTAGEEDNGDAHEKMDVDMTALVPPVTVEVGADAKEQKEKDKKSKDKKSRSKKEKSKTA